MLGIVIRSKMKNQCQKLIWRILPTYSNHYVENYFLSWITYNCSIIHKHDGCPISDLSKRLSQNLLSFNKWELFLKIRTTIEFLVT